MQAHATGCRDCLSGQYTFGWCRWHHAGLLILWQVNPGEGGLWQLCHAYLSACCALDIHCCVDCQLNSLPEDAALAAATMLHVSARIAGVVLLSGAYSLAGLPNIEQR